MKNTIDCLQNHEDHQQKERLMEIKYGSTRTVFLVGNFAIKVPSFVQWSLFLQGLLANINETKFSKVKIFNNLCPVVFSIPGGFLNVMPLCQPITMTDFKYHMVEIKNFGVEVEPKLDSFGWLEGKIVAVDYGN